MIEQLATVQGEAMSHACRPASSRRPRADKGIPQGTRRPRQPSSFTRHPDHVAMTLTGKHGTGNTLLLSREDFPLVWQHSEKGARLFVVSDGAGKTVNVRIKGPFAQAFANSHNPKHNISVGRLLIGEGNSGRSIQTVNGNPFDMRRENLFRKSNASGDRFAIDWPKAEVRRAALIGAALAKMPSQSTATLAS